MKYAICPACETRNDIAEEYCLNCGQKLIDNKDNGKILNEKLSIPKDKIILLDLNYTLISNSWQIRYDNYVILITASPYYTSFDSLKHISENTDLVIKESYWNFGKRPHELKHYWMKKAVLPTHGNDPDKYLAIESNPKTRAMYKKLGIEARAKNDFI